MIVYNRLHNLKTWIKSWNLCEKENAELVIVHNFDKIEDTVEYRKVCEDANITYIPRPNVGMDVGAFQDICRNRLKDFPSDWDYLFWVTDDVLPTSKVFLKYFSQWLGDPTVGVVCLEVSKEVKVHIRTTGFLIHKDVASQITFPADPVISKNHCYEFEHRSYNAFYEQIKALNKRIIQVNPNVRQSYLWDTHARANFDRWVDHYNEFPR